MKFLVIAVLGHFFWGRRYPVRDSKKNIKKKNVEAILEYGLSKIRHIFAFKYDIKLSNKLLGCALNLTSKRDLYEDWNFCKRLM